VQLVAVDLNAIAMTKGPVAPTGAEMTEAVKKLQDRVPLGSTDMEKGPGGGGGPVGKPGAVPAPCSTLATA